MGKIIGFLVALSALTGCGPSPESDPIYQQLKANPPKEIPARHLPRLRRGIPACDVYNEGKANQYMTCWWSAGIGNPTAAAMLSYYRPNPMRPPHPGMASGMSPGTSITGYDYPIK